MKRRKRRIMLLWFLCFTLTFSKEINLQKAIEIALKGNKDIKIQKLEKQKLQLEVKKQKKKFLPQVDLAVGQNEYSKSFNPLKNHQGTDDKISVKLPLFIGFENVNNLKKSKLELEKNSYTALRMEEYIRQSVTQKYFQILYFQDQKKLLERNKIILKEALIRVEDLYKANNLVTKSEVYLAKQNYEYNNINIIDLDNQLNQAFSEFKYLLSLPSDSKITLADQEENTLDIKEEPLDLMIKKSVEKGSRVNNSEIDVEIANLNKELAESNYYPKVYLQGEYNFTKAQKREKDSRLSVYMTWNLFKWGSDFDTVSQRKIDIEEEKIKLLKEKQDVKSEITLKLGNIKRIKQEILSQNYGLQRAKEDFERSIVQYKASNITYSEYMSSLNELKLEEKTYYDLQRELIKAIYQYKNSWK